MDAKETYRIFSLFYDRYAGGFESDIPIYSEYTRDCERILEIGCGTGRVLGKLARPGVKLTGVDISEEMLAIARAKLHHEVESGGIELLRHDFTLEPLPGKFDIALITWYTFNYILYEPSAFLKNVSASLVPGAPVLLDLFRPNSYTHPETDDRWTRKDIVAENTVYSLRDKRTVRNGIEERIQIITLDDRTHTVVTDRKYYSKSDTAALLAGAGFSKIRFMENYDASTLRESDSERPDDGGYLCIAENSPSSSGRQ